MSVLVSVCVITHNHENYIAECLDAILSQKTNFQFDVFVSDDCSSDSTLKILESYQERFPNVHIISRCGKPKSQVNGRPTGNLNFIENLCRTNSKYIATCDGDDVWASETKLQKQIDILEQKTDVALVCTSKRKLIENRFIESKVAVPDITFSSKLLCFYNPIPSSSVVFRRELLKEPPEWFYNKLDVGDWPFWFMVAAGKNIVKLGEVLLNYRVHPSGAWGEKRKSEKALSALNVVETLKSEYGDFLLYLSAPLHFIRYTFHKIKERL